MNIERILGGLVSLGIVADLATHGPGEESSCGYPASRGQRNRNARQTPGTLEGLNLTNDQKAMVKDLFADAKSKREAVWNDAHR
jgi:Spy/CpxP family protein refolding chaperone